MLNCPEFRSRVCERVAFSGTGAVPLNTRVCACALGFADAFQPGDRVSYVLQSCPDCAPYPQEAETGEAETGETQTGQYETGEGVWDGTHLNRTAAGVEAPVAGVLTDFTAAEVFVSAALNPAFLHAVCQAAGDNSAAQSCAFPVGKIIAWQAASFPGQGWLPMDGTTRRSARVYTALSALFTVTDESFVIPNLFGGRSKLGSNAVFARGQTGGAESTALTGADFAHEHAMFTAGRRVENLINATAPYVTAGDYTASEFQGNGFFGAVNVASYIKAASPNPNLTPELGRTSAPVTPNGQVIAAGAAHNTMHPFAVTDFYIWSGVC